MYIWSFKSKKCSSSLKTCHMVVDLLVVETRQPKFFESEQDALILINIKYIDTLNIKWIVVWVSWRVDFSVSHGITIVSEQACTVLVDASAHYTEFGEERIVGFEVGWIGQITIYGMKLEDHFRID